MRLNELVKSFDIFMTNEEKQLLGTIPSRATRFDLFNEHQQIILNNLIKKSIIQKINNEGIIFIKKNVQ